MATLGAVATINKVTAAAAAATVIVAVEAAGNSRGGLKKRVSFSVMIF